MAASTAAVKIESEPIGRRNPGGAGAERCIGGQTARQSTTPCREVGRRAWGALRPQLRCGVEHEASLQNGHAALPA